jgi:hypothetical protein
MSKFRAATLILASVALSVMFGGVATAANGNGHGNASSHAASQSNAGTHGPSARAKYGMCTAYVHGKGGTNGKKAQASAFKALTAATGLDTAEAVKTFCQGFVASHTPSGHAIKSTHPRGATPPASTAPDAGSSDAGTTTTTDSHGSPRGTARD